MKRIRKVLSLRPARPGGGARGAARVLVACLCCLAPLLAVTCATGPKAAVGPDAPLWGTWVNAEYEGTIDFAAKIVMFPDGRVLEYDQLSSTKPEFEGKNSIMETWIDAEGNHWYKGRGMWVDSDAVQQESWPWYFMHKINPAGMVLESVSSEVGYPEEMGPLGGFYGTWNRQE